MSFPPDDEASDPSPGGTNAGSSRLKAIDATTVRAADIDARDVEDPSWFREQPDGFVGLWHMPAGRFVAGVLTACDRPFRDDGQLEERPVTMVPANERCPVCQGIQAAEERNRD